MSGKGEVMKFSKEKIIENLSQEAEKVYVSNSPEGTDKNLLLIVPDLKLGGAMTVLMELLKLTRIKEYCIYVISAEDGSYREKMINIGASVVIRPYVICSEKYRKNLQSMFDYVFINSAGCYYYVYYFLNTDVKVFWWFHETRTQLQTMQKEFLNLCLLSDNISMAGVTKAVQRGVQELYGKEIAVLAMPVHEHKHKRKQCIENKKEKVVFFIPAALTYIKGQDILLRTISMLPEAYRKKSKFVFCGYHLPEQEEYANNILQVISVLENTEFLGCLDKEEVYEWYQKCDCVIAPSRVDATPTTVVEAMMFEKLCVVSDATGISEYMTDCVNGFVFPSENIDELLKRIMLIIMDNDNLQFVANAGRMIYDNNFCEKVVERQLEQLWK